MDEKGQAFSTFQLLIAAIVAVAILIILMSILGMIPEIGPEGDPVQAMADSLQAANSNLASAVAGKGVTFTSDSPIVTSEMVVRRAGVGLEARQVCISPGEFLLEETETGTSWGHMDDARKQWKAYEDGSALRYVGQQRTVSLSAICYYSGPELRTYLEDYMEGHIDADWMESHGTNRFECECLRDEYAGQRCCLIALRFVRS